MPTRKRGDDMRYLVFIKVERHPEGCRYCLVNVAVV
ncbi:Uncharacterised protein [Vibrio cholerae]|nr:Uncharacterised protein [Vibrio cholerae]